MRKGALTTGRNICNSRPVDIRGFHVVEPRTCRSCEGAGFRIAKPAQLYPASSLGHPKGVLITAEYCCAAICSCERRRMGSMPVSTNGAIATGPAMVMRYSRLVTRLRSPPGKTIWSTGIGTVQQLVGWGGFRLALAGLQGKLGLAGTGD